MYEYQSEAIVLDAVPAGESDTRFFLYTKKYGRIVARAQSARKITSKLTPHLQAGDVAEIRVVEKNGLRLADALKMRRLPHAPGDLWGLNRLLHDTERDDRLWHALCADMYSWRGVLTLIGWNPERAICARCRSAGQAFLIGTQEFVCETHASKLPPGAVVSIA